MKAIMKNLDQAAKVVTTKQLNMLKNACKKMLPKEFTGKKGAMIPFYIKSETSGRDSYEFNSKFQNTYLMSNTTTPLISSKKQN
jgi:hypothetical protein